MDKKKITPHPQLTSSGGLDTEMYPNITRSIQKNFHDIEENLLALSACRFHGVSRQKISEKVTRLSRNTDELQKAKLPSEVKDSLDSLGKEANALAASLTEEVGEYFESKHESAIETMYNIRAFAARSRVEVSIVLNRYFSDDPELTEYPRSRSQLMPHFVPRLTNSIFLHLYTTARAVLCMCIFIILAISACSPHVWQDGSSVLENPGTLYVGEYRSVQVTIPHNAAYSFDDLQFRVVEGDKAGQISRSRGSDFDDSRPSVMLLGGWLPGEYTLSAEHNGVEIARVPFSVTAEWLDQDQGPPRWMQGATNSDGGPIFATWGSDTGTAGFENYKIKEQIGHRQLLMVFLEFADVRFTEDADEMSEIEEYWMQNAVTGYLHNGQMRSMAAYWNEVSGGRLTVDVTPIGPIRVDMSMRDFMMGPDQQHYQLAVTKILEDDNSFDFTQYFSVLFVSPEWNFVADRSCTPTNNGVEVCDGIDNSCDGLVDAQDPNIPFCASEPVCGDGVVDASEECDDGDENHKWARCSTQCRLDRNISVWPIFREPQFVIANNESLKFRFIQMPHDWAKIDRRRRPVYATLAHEFGHALGLGDLYGGSPPVYQRAMGQWDLMANETELPHINLSQRMQLGWVDEADLASFRLGALTQTLRLSPVERSRPFTNSYRGLEIRLTGGHNYYWEYRLGQANQIGDRGSPIRQLEPGTVLGTDHLGNTSSSAENRRQIAMVPVLGPSQGPGLGPQDTFVQRDPTPGGDKHLIVNFTHIEDGTAVIEVDYNQFGADPAIRPWPSPDHRWQSPDIEIVNAKNRGTEASALQWKNVPWAENHNDIIASVSNLGNIDAPNVVVNFYAQLFNAGDNSSSITTPLGQVEKDIPAGATVEFVGAWIPPPNPGHYCVIADIRPYAHPELAEVELSMNNNRAQSNYTRFWSASSSPAQRHIVPLSISNPYPHETIIHVSAEQSHPHFRTYIEGTWFRLAPGEQRSVITMYEYKESFNDMYNEIQDYHPENKVSLYTWAASFNEESGDPDEHGVEILGGASVSVLAGYATRIILENIPNPSDQSGQIIGVVTNESNGDTIGLGSIVVRVDYQGASAPTYEIVTVSQDGTFELQTLAPWERIDVEFLGAPPYAPSKIQRLRQ